MVGTLLISVSGFLVNFCLCILVFVSVCFKEQTLAEIHLPFYRVCALCQFHRLIGLPIE